MRRKAWLIALPGQVAVVGLVISLLDHFALRSATQHVRRSVDDLGAPGDTPIPGDARAELERYGEIASAVARPVMLLLVIPMVALALVAVLLWRGSPRATGAGLVTMGLLTPPYLACLVGVFFTDLAYGLQSVSQVTVDPVRSPIPDWYVPARAAVLGAAAMAYLTGLFLLTRPAATNWRTMPARGTVPLLMAHLPLVRVNVTVLTFVALGQAGPIAREQVRAAPPDHYAGVGEMYLEQATRIAGHYAVALAAAGAIALVLAAIAWRAGASARLLVVMGVAGIPFMFLLLLVSAGTPFMFSGAGDEPVPEVLGSGPSWYLPAILTQTSLGALAYIACVVLLVRTAGTGPADTAA
ncbi:hypothetical protein GCM10022226_24490 [Sphaerisporangium flaviroseum]|uniref:ABC transporter permease n=1 Tax=Sphaerisporangium flaviroseum TaxID=509199 RepID=A0ABP7HT79_9ACTN